MKIFAAKNPAIILLILLMVFTVACNSAAVPKDEASSGLSTSIQASSEEEQNSVSSAVTETEKPKPESSSSASPQESSIPQAEFSQTSSYAAEEKPQSVPDSSSSQQAEVVDSIIPPLSEIMSIYARNPIGHTYVGDWVTLTHEHLTDLAIETNTALVLFNSLETAGKELKIYSHEFLLWTNDGIRHSYGITQDGYFAADGKAYLLTQEQTQEIQLFHKYLLESEFSRAYPQWLAWMTPSKVSEIIFHSPTRGALTITPALTEDIADFIKMYTVKPIGDDTYTLGSVDFSGDDVFHVEIHFDNGIIYNIYAKNANGYEGDYYVESSDKPYGCKYRFMMSSIDGVAAFLIESFEYIADAKTAKDLENPLT